MQIWLQKKVKKQNRHITQSKECLFIITLFEYDAVSSSSVMQDDTKSWRKVEVKVELCVYMKKMTNNRKAEV